MEQPALKQSPSKVGFKIFVFSENRIYCLIILTLMMGQFIIFKLCYPFPDFFSDSYSYIEAAFYRWDVNIWPIGYSRFLLLFHWVTTSGLALVFFQYMVWSLSALYFYLTIVYFYHTGRNTRIFLCLFLFFNPLFLYLANYVTSDMLFVSMSTVWLAQLLWILRRPRAYMVFTQATLMLLMFTFRYNAMVYPFIAAGVILLSKQQAWIKVAGIVAGPVLILPFVVWSSQAAKVVTGTAQFPPILGGWQWGNNALYMRGFIEEDSTVFPTPQTAELDQIARRYFNQPDRPQDLLFSEVANFFIRHWDAPLKVYMTRHYHPKTSAEDVAGWGKSAVVFDQYGKFLIKRHPLAFARYYLLVNTKNYFIPPLEKLEVYNLGQDEIWQSGQFWFHYKNPKVWSISKPLQGVILALFPAFFLILNIYYAIGLYLFIGRGGLRRVSRNFLYPLLIVTAFLSINAAFSIFANIIVIRYEIFPMIVFLAFAMLITDYAEILLFRGQRNSDHAALPKALRTNPMSK